MNAKTKIYFGIGCLLLYLTVVSAFLAHIGGPSPVQAQGGSFFSRTYQVPVNSFTQYIPACTTSQAGCIPNYEQVGQTINYTFTTNPGSQLLANCAILLDGSNDGTNWVTFGASGNAFGQKVGSFSANAYYPFRRLKIPECISAITIVYIGYGSSVTVNPQPFPGPSRLGVIATNVQGVVRADPVWSTPAVFTSFQCSNPDPTNEAWLQLFVAASTPTIAQGNMTFGIPPAQTITYSGPALSYYALSVGTITATGLYAAATTSATGATPVATAIICNFQTNGTGPYYPWNPPSS